MEQSNLGKSESEYDENIIQLSSPATEEMLGIEVTLLVAAAAGKGINVSIWIAAPDDGIMNFSTFCSKLTSLSRVVGVDEDWETKRELDLATSKPELLVILRICHAGIDALGNPMINTKKFLSLCKERVNGYLLQMSRGITQMIYSLLKLIFLPPVDNSQSQFIKEELRATDDDITSTMARSINVSNQDENKKQRPQSAPCTRKTSQNNNISYSQVITSSDNTVNDLDTGPETTDVIMPSSTTRIVIPQKNTPMRCSKPTLKSFDGFPAIKVSIDELNKLQEELQQKLCILVSKSNLYHIILAQLGFLYDRELSKSPLASAALASRAKKLWLTSSDVQMIFSSVQFQLQRHHITILIGLIEKYKLIAYEIELKIQQNKDKDKDKETKKSKADSKGNPTTKTTTTTTTATETETETEKKDDKKIDTTIMPAYNEPVTKTSHLLSATWLQRYLVYLRHRGRKSLTKQRNKTEKSRVEGVPGGGEPVSSGGGGGGVPGGNSAKKRSAVEVESLDRLKRALAGLPHSLTEATVNLLLQSYEILSEEDVQREIAIRCKLWKIDADGRGDYRHQLRVQVLREIKAIADPNSKQDERLIKQTVYNDFKDSELQLFRDKAKISLMNQMEEKLLKSEQNDSDITKSLFWKFIKDKDKNKGTNFGSWLKEYFEKTEAKFLKIQSEIKNRKAEAVASRRSSKGLTPLTHIVSKIEDVADALTNNDIKMELRRSLSVLRKEETERAMEFSQSTPTSITSSRSGKLTKSCHCRVKSHCPHEYLLVTRERFDRLFVNALSSSVTEIPGEAVCVEEVLKEHRNRYRAKDSTEETKTAGSSASSGAGSGAGAAGGVSKLPPEKRLFLGSEELAMRRAKELRNAMRKESKEAMSRWWGAKKRAMEDEEKKKIQRQQELEDEKKLKRQQAKRAFRTWSELRDQDLYLSQSGEMKPLQYSYTSSGHTSSGGAKGKPKRRPAWDDSFVVDPMEL